MIRGEKALGIVFAVVAMILSVVAVVLALI